MYFFNITNDGNSNSDSAVLARTATYSSVIFDTALSSAAAPLQHNAPIDWTNFDWYLVSTAFSSAGFDNIGARYISLK